MKRNILLLVCVTTAVRLAAQFGGFGGGGQNTTIPARSIGVVKESTRVFTASASGRGQPVNTVAHSASVAGIVSDVLVQVGQRVAVGDALYSVARSGVDGNYAPFLVRSRVAGIVATVTARRDNEIKSGEVGVTVIETYEFSMSALMSDKDAFAVEIGQAVEGRTPEGQTVRGRLVGRSPEPDYQTGLYTVTFRFSGSTGLKPGQYLTVDLPVEQVTGVFVSQRLLFRRYGRYYLWVVGDDDTLVSREVVSGRTHGDDIMIVEGLAPGDRILLQRRGNEREGTPVERPAN